MNVVVPVRVSRELAEEINELVDAGFYPSRSDLIREALRRLTASERELIQKTRIGRVVSTIASTIIAWSEETVTDVLLLGSTARGEATAESDIDLLVLVENEEPWMVRQRLYDTIYPISPYSQIL